MDRAYVACGGTGAVSVPGQEKNGEEQKEAYKEYQKDKEIVEDAENTNEDD